MAQATIKESTDMDAMLTRLTNIEKGTKKAAQSGAKILVAVTKSVTPKGDPKDKPHLKPLARTIDHVYRQYGPNKGLAVVGPSYPAGAHGHLVELGHKASGWNENGPAVPGKYFMLRAYEMCKDRIDRTVVTTLAHEIKAKGG